MNVYFIIKKFKTKPIHISGFENSQQKTTFSPHELTGFSKIYFYVLSLYPGPTLTHGANRKNP